METQELKIPNFGTKKELHEFLVANKSTLTAQKKAQFKRADSQPYLGPVNSETGKATKAALDQIELANAEAIKVYPVINTTNFLDSHNDVHIPGLWNKSLRDSAKYLMHIQEHKSHEFDKIISDGEDLKAYVKNYTWRELGYNVDGKTEGLTFDSVIKRKRNKFMFEQYSEGYVKSHSVGMWYDTVILCIDNEDYGAEYEAWEKYYPQIVNQDKADAKGWFWAVTKARVFEGSAVPLGSNIITPNLGIEIVKGQEPLKDTPGPAAAKALQDQNNFFKHLI